jgi:hypothetical protein
MRKFIVLMMFAGVLSSCGVALKTKRPELPALRQEIPCSESYFNIPVELNLAEISKTLSTQLPMQLYKQNGLDVGHGIKMDVAVTRRGGFSFSTLNGNMNMSVPLNITGTANLSTKLCSFCPAIEKSQSFNFDVTVNTSSKLGIAPDWSLQTKTSTDLHLDTPPIIRVLGFDISLESVTNKIIRSQIPKLDGLINEKINHSYDIKDKAKTFWNKISQPLLVMNSPVNIWIGITPTEFNAAPAVSVDENNMLLNIGMKTKIYTFIGEKPTFSNPPVLPPVNSNPVKENQFVTDIPVTVQMSEIVKIARKELVGKTIAIPEAKRDVTINDVDIYGSGNTLIIMVNITSKKIKGNLYIVADPLYDKNAKMFKVDNLKFDAQTNSVLTNKAAWLANKILMHSIEKKITYNVGKEINDVQVKLDQSLDNLSFNGILSLKAQINDLEVQNMFFDASYAYLNLKVKGNIHVLVK